jgi:hypothetical protein
MAILGGLLMMASGYVSRGLLFTALGVAQDKVPDYLTGYAAGASSLAITALELVIALGGFAVLLGGVAILYLHATTGRLLIYLGGGAGLLSLVLSMAYSTYRLGYDSTLQYAPYWVGVAMAVAARRLAKSP